MKTLLLTIFLFLTFTINLFPQSTPEPLYHDVYSFLQRLAQKGVIEFNDEIRPLPRKYIFEKLVEVREKIQRFKGSEVQRINITSLEIEELEFYLRDYNLELQFSSVQRPASSVQKKESDEGISSVQDNNPIIQSSNNPTLYLSSSLNWFKDNLGRYRLFSYSSNLFKVNFDPILGYEIGKRNGNSYSHLWNGIKFYGYVSNWLGFSFDFRDNAESGKELDKEKEFTPETGVVISRNKPEHFEYSRANTSLNFTWSWGSVLVGKEPIVWGYGESGLLVHSTKAPTYPMIRLDLTFTKWLRFNYFHGWLSSDVIDSSASYPTLREGQERTIIRKKFIASHTLILTPLDGLSVSLGESVIYSDNLEPLYLFPLMFFRAADHYLSNRAGGNNSGANSQFFLGISSRNHIPNTHLYGTFFIDEITIGELFNPEKQRTQIAFQIGGSVVDFPIDNLTATIEYTKIYPFVYRHYIPTQTYANHDYVLGDWMGHNSDRIYGSLNYRILRGLQVKLWGEYIRKGEDGEVEDQYVVPQPPFLFGLRTNFTRWGITAKYEIVHDLFVRIRYNNFLTSEEQENGNFVDSRQDEFYFAVYYGM